MKLNTLASRFFVRVMFSSVFASMIVIVLFFLLSDFHAYLGSLENGTFFQLGIFTILFLLMVLSLVLSGRVKVSEQPQSNSGDLGGLLDLDARLVGLSFLEGFIKGFTRAQSSQKEGIPGQKSTEFTR